MCCRAESREERTPPGFAVLRDRPPALRVLQHVQVVEVDLRAERTEATMAAFLAVFEDL